MSIAPKHKVMPFVENILESTTACLVTMVQGNLVALTWTHWAIASQTGIVAGSIASAALLVTRSSAPWVVSAVLGVVTAVVDFFVHPGAIGPVAREAVLTGVGAALLSYLLALALRVARARRVGK